MSNCPGNYTIIEKNQKKIKSCIDCTFPHKKENYDKINEIIKMNNLTNLKEYTQEDLVLLKAEDV